MIEVKVPELAESISEASIESWQVAEGDSVITGQVICLIETDKVMLEVPAQEDGVITKIIKVAGEDVASAEVIGQLEPGEVTAPAAAPAAVAVTEATPAAHAPSSPSARQAAADQNVNIAQVAGSGKDGRISKQDVAKPQAVAAATATAVLPVPGTRGERREKMSKLRSMIAQRLLQSQQQAAILTTFNEVDMTEIMALRKQFRDEFEKTNGIKLGFMSFFVKAAVAALRRYPIVNAGIDGDSIVHHDFCDVSIAVGSPRGLVVPVLRNAENMNFQQIESSISDFGARAQTGTLRIDELTGGTFTITNGGTFGSMLSTPIINPPQSAILGVHATKERAVIVDGEVVIRPINYLALSYDHRIIDGRDAVLFLVAIKDALEQPARLLLDL